MYSLVSAIAKSRNADGRWSALDIGSLTFDTLYSQYLRVIATLSNEFLPANVALDLEAIRAQVGSTSQTFNDYLVSIGSNALPTTDDLPVLRHQTVRYMDAFRAGFQVQPIAPNAAPDADVPELDKTWLYVTKPGINFHDFEDYCLVTVNGFVHRVAADANAAYVVDGMKSVFKSKEATMGLINFQKVSKLTYVPITEQMIFKQNPDQAYRNQMYVDLGQDISNKEIMLVLGGYLHVLDTRTFYRMNDTTVVIDFNNLSLFERIHESMPYLDFSSLPYDRTDRNETMFNSDNFLSDENLVAYATLSQSFFVLLDNVEIFKDSQAVETLPMPGQLISYVEPTYPLVNGVGKFAEYWSIHDYGQWSLRVPDNYWHQRQYNTTPLLDNRGVADSRVPTDPVRHSRAKFLILGTDLEYVPS